MIRKSFAALCGLIALCVLVNSHTTAVAYPASSVDTDFDGLPDEWEVRGRGGLAAGVARVGRRDLIIYALRRGGVSDADTRAIMRRVTQFYADFPVTNADGSRGITMTVIYGPEMDRADWETPYEEPSLFNRYIQPNLRGIARHIIIETKSGCGGQTLSPEWSASCQPWQSVAHEIGHQIGLNHTPPNQPTGGLSPLWTSIMSYMYTGGFNGSPDAVHFSRGEFVGLPLNESNLSEVLPRPRSRLTFLERDPNNFMLESRGASATGVDWNRNGRIDDGRIAADINDGYGVESRALALTPDRTSSAPALAVVGNRLVVVYSRLRSEPENWTAPDTSSDPTGRYYASVLQASGEMSPGRAISAGGGGAPSDPSAVGVGDLLAVAHTQNRLGILSLYEVTATGVGPRRHVLSDFTERMDQTIVASAQLTDGSRPIYLIGWDRLSGRIRIATVTQTGSGASARYQLARGAFQDITAPGVQIRSAGPIGAAVDPLNGHLAIVYHDRAGRGVDGAFLRVMRLSNIGASWGMLSQRWVGGVDPNAQSTSAPTITFDPTSQISSRSQMNVYARGVPDPASSRALAVTLKYREIADRRQNDGWRTRMMIDDWNASQSATTAVHYQGADAFALRWRYDDPRPNLLVIYTATGVSDVTLRDHDDVTYIGNTWLARTLSGLRCYLGGEINFELSPSEC